MRVFAQFIREGSDIEVGNMRQEKASTELVKEIDQAVRQWRRELRTNVGREMIFFRKLLPSLLAKHKGVYVALADGKVVDQDFDEGSLVRRVGQVMPNKFVLIQQVCDETPAAAVIESPGVVE
jgi:hypothetical protein